MAYKFMASLLGLLLLACSSIHAAYTNTKGNFLSNEHHTFIQCIYAIRLKQFWAEIWVL